MKKKRIRNLTDHVLVLNKMTVDRGEEIELWNNEALDSEEVKRALEAKEIEIIEPVD